MKKPEWKQVVHDDGWISHEIVIGHLYLDVAQSKDRKKWETSVCDEQGTCLDKGRSFNATALKTAKNYLLGLAAGVAQTQADKVARLSVLALT